MRVRSPAFCRLPFQGIAISEIHRARTDIVGLLDNSLRLSPQQQAQWEAKVHEAEFREPDISSDLLGAGLWIAYAVFALVWFRGVAQRRTLRWLATVGERVVAPLIARQRVRYLENEKVLEPRRPRIVLEPLTSRT
jgi:hypothetical protein